MKTCTQTHLTKQYTHNATYIHTHTKKITLEKFKEYALKHLRSDRSKHAKSGHLATFALLTITEKILNDKFAS